MKSDADIAAPKRAYRQGARAEAAEATAARILEVFRRRLSEDWYDLITLDQVAREAGVTVPTIIRRFGNKEGLLEETQKRMDAEILGRRSVAPGDLDALIRVLIEDYEAVGDLVIRTLSQEERYPVFRIVTDVGRAGHRLWIEQGFSPWLDGLAADARQARLDALVVATDLYVWKLVRRDMGRSPDHLRELMLTLIRGIIGQGPTPASQSGGDAK